MTATRSSRPVLALGAALLILGAGAGPGSQPGSTNRPAWGPAGHEMVARLAVARLPEGMPAFFGEAGEKLVYLNPEPDRWRVRPQREMDQAFAPDHYIDLENATPGSLEAADRYAFIHLLHEAGVERPERAVGFLPFRIVELYQRTVVGWRRWRAEPDPLRLAWIEERIVADAGILGHYVADAAQPHHTTIHFNGWDPETANPEGYTTDRGFHGRFENAFVDAHVSYDDVARQIDPDRSPVSVAGDARSAVMGHILEAHAEVERLYALDRDEGFDPFAPASEMAVNFAARRMAAGAEMLATLWWSAWLESGAPLDGTRP